MSDNAPEGCKRILSRMLGVQEDDFNFLYGPELVKVAGI